MNTLKRIYFLIFLLAWNIGNAQVNFTANAEDADDDGLVRTQVMYRNPDGFDKDKVVISESGKEIELSDFSRIPTDSISKEEGELVLILYENHHSRRYQRDFFNEVLSLAAEELVDENDDFLFASFDWDRDELDGKYLDFASLTPTNDPADLINWSESVEAKSHLYSRKSTRIYGSIYQGIDYLSEIESDKPKAIIVLSSGYNDVYDQEWDATAVIAKSLQENIPVYSIALDLPNVDDKYNLDNICEETFGLSTGPFKKTSAVTASKKLISIADQISPRSSGSQFKMAHKTSYDKDGKSHDFQLSIEGSAPENIAYSTKSPTFLDWVKSNPIIASIIGVLFVGILILIIILMKKRKNDREAKEAEQAKKVAELQSQGQHAQSEIEKQKEILQHKEDRERIQGEKALAEKQEKARKKKEEETILLMSQSGFPRLAGEFQGQHGELELNKPLVSIGRKEGNYYVVNHATVSSAHAEVRFEDGKYIIKDLNSSNGTMVNGLKIKEEELKHGDVVSFGEVTLTYLK